ncbi:hypothetical protein F5888DRAFT_1669819 [Russula emetica]|nr:hypothetical protein F5888DRAFT_1669819 [Russula emetica]
MRLLWGTHLDSLLFSVFVLTDFLIVGFSREVIFVSTTFACWEAHGQHYFPMGEVMVLSPKRSDCSPFQAESADYSTTRCSAVHRRIPPFADFRILRRVCYKHASTHGDSPHPQFSFRPF